MEIILFGIFASVIAQTQLLSISNDFLIYAEKTSTLKRAGKLNPKFILALNETVEDGENATYALWYLTVETDEHGQPLEVHITSNETKSHFWAWGNNIPNDGVYVHSENVLGWYGEDGSAELDTDWFLGLVRDETAPWKLYPKKIEVNKLWRRYDTTFTGRSHQYWHLDRDDRLVSRATGNVLAGVAFNKTAALGLVRKVKNTDSFAPLQNWIVIENSTSSENWTWINDTRMEKQLMMQEDGMARVTGWDLTYMKTNEYFEEFYNYYDRSRYEFYSESTGYDLHADACNTEVIREDDELFGLYARSPSPYRSNWTTHSGADHFMYGEDFNSEKIGPESIRGGISAQKWVSSIDDVQITQHFPRGNWSWQFDETNGQTPMLVTVDANFTLHNVDYQLKYNWHILYMLNQFDRYQIDAIVGDDPFEESFTPKWADCDKGVVRLEETRPPLLESTNINTRLEFVDEVSSTVSASEYSFDFERNVTRIYYYDFDSGAYIRRIEMKESQTAYELNMDTRSCSIKDLGKNNNNAYDFFKLPETAVYNEPRNLRENVKTDSWLKTYLDEISSTQFSDKKNVTCSDIYYYPGYWHSYRDSYRWNCEHGMLMGYESRCLDENSTLARSDSVNNFANQDFVYDDSRFDTSMCYPYKLFDFYFTMTGPYSKLTPSLGYDFPDEVITQIEVATGLTLQTRIQHVHVDLYTVNELEIPEIMIRFSLLPYTAFNDFIDLTNEEFFERLKDPVNSGMIAVEFRATNSSNPDGLLFHSVAESLAVSYDNGIVYEPTSNKTVTKTIIVHQAGYSSGGMIAMAFACIIISAGLLVVITWVRFKRSSATAYETLE